MHFYMNMSTRQHRAGPPCPPGGSERPVCGAGDLTRPAHRTSVIRSGRGGPPGRRRFPWMYTGTPPSAAVREPDLSPVARILPRAARFSTCLAVDGHRGPSRTSRVATSLGRSLPGPDAGHPLQGAGQSRKKELDVPVACPIGRSSGVSHGHQRAAWHLSRPAAKQLTASALTTFQAGGQRRPTSGHDSHAPCLAGSFVMRMTVKITTNLGQASTTVEGPHGL
jgi:hypothetical protein